MHVAEFDGDGRASVALAELIALRTRVSKLSPPMEQVRASHSGQRASRLHGRGMDYAESRIYQPGDDVRRLDWRLTARSGRLHTKLFEEEREGRLLILVDQHASMHFGTRERFKSVQAARAAALAAWYAVRGGDRVGALGFGRGEFQLRPRGGARGALALCGALAQWDRADPSPQGESLGEALRRARKLARGSSRVLLISDGWHIDEQSRGRLLDLRRHADVGILIVADVLESAPPPAGRFPLDVEGKRIEVWLGGERDRHAFQRMLSDGRQRLTALASSLALPCVTIDTVADPLDAVLTLAGRRRERG